MLYNCTLTAVIEVCGNRIFPVCYRQLCFFSIQSYGRAYLTPWGALPTMWGKIREKDKREDVAKYENWKFNLKIWWGRTRGVEGTHNSCLMLKGCLFQSFSSAGRICSERFIISTEHTWFLPLVFIYLKEVMKLFCFAHTFLLFSVALFLAGRIYCLMRSSIFSDPFWNVKRATFVIAAKQLFNIGLGFLLFS